MTDRKKISKIFSKFDFCSNTNYHKIICYIRHENPNFYDSKNFQILQSITDVVNKLFDQNDMLNYIDCHRNGLFLECLEEPYFWAMGSNSYSPNYPNYVYIDPFSNQETTMTADDINPISLRQEPAIAHVVTIGASGNNCIMNTQDLPGVLELDAN